MYRIMAIFSGFSLRDQYRIIRSQVSVHKLKMWQGNHYWSHVLLNRNKGVRRKGCENIHERLYLEVSEKESYWKKMSMIRPYDQVTNSINYDVTSIKF